MTNHSWTDLPLLSLRSFAATTPAGHPIPAAVPSGTPSASLGRSRPLLALSGSAPVPCHLRRELLISLPEGVIVGRIRETILHVAVRHIRWKREQESNVFTSVLVKR